MMPAFHSVTTFLSAFIARHARFLIAILIAILGLLLSADSSSEESSAVFRFLALSSIIVMIVVIVEFVILSAFRPIADILMRFIPRYDGFDPIIEWLTLIVERSFPNGSPLEENSVRGLTFLACKNIYGHTRDVVTGSLAVAILLSYILQLLGNHRARRP